MKWTRPEWWLIIWEDAEADLGWAPDEEVKVSRNPAMSVGVILREDNGFLVLAADVGRCGSGRQTNRRIEIPLQNVLRRIKMVQSRAKK